MRHMLVGMVLLLLVARAAVADLEARTIDWIESLPGVHVISSEDKQFQVRRMYYAESTAETMQALRWELLRRGWTLAAGNGQPVVLATLQSQQRKLCLSAAFQKEVVNGGNMLLWVYEVGAKGNPRTVPNRVVTSGYPGGAASGAAPKSAPVAAAVPQGASPSPRAASPHDTSSPPSPRAAAARDETPSSAAAVKNDTAPPPRAKAVPRREASDVSDLRVDTLKGAGERRAYRVSGPLTVAGGDNELTLSGNCPKLIIDGDRNRITGPCRYRQIVINGQNNSMQWSSVTNSRVPVVDNNGSNNVLERQ